MTRFSSDKLVQTFEELSYIKYEVSNNMAVNLKITQFKSMTIYTTMHITCTRGGVDVATPTQVVVEST